MNAPLIAAGCLALLGAAIHGGAGEVLVMRRLSLPDLPSTRFGGPRMTMAMLHASWHLTTVAFLTTAVALLLSGSVLDGDAARGVARVAAAAAAGFAAVVLALGVADTGSPRSILRHPGPIMLTVIAALACWGAF